MNDAHWSGKGSRNVALGELADPRTDEPPLVVVFAANEAYVAAAAAMLHSVASHLRRPSLHVFILDDGLSARSRSRLEGITTRFPPATTVTWLRPDISAVAEIRTPGEWPHAIFLRLLIGSLLPATVKRVIYLDTDVIVRADLTELWETPLHGCPVAAAKNHVPSTWGEHGLATFRDKAGLDPSGPYFNSGVLLIDLDVWRRERVEERSLEFAHRYAAELPYPDQDALNAVLVDRWRVLPPEWNVLSTVYVLSAWPDSELKQELLANEWTVLNGPKVVHYIGQPKPWMPASTHPLRDLFRRHLRDSGWEQTTSKGFGLWNSTVGRLAAAFTGTRR
jgi:lipopolysaccharide biosynthesis glycosyltransferase